MSSVLERALTTITDSLTALWQWLSTVATGLSASFTVNPANWSPAVWAGVVTLIIVCVLLGLRRPRRASSLPELLVSKGEVRQKDAGSAQVLVLKVSNLNEYPVHLLEMTLQTELMSSALIIEAAELLSGGETAELEATLPNNMSGESGTLLVYAMQIRRQKLYQLKASFDWEPWAMRYKVSPLGQKVKAIRKLESERLNKLRKRAWHKQYFYEPDGQTRTSAPQQEPRDTSVYNVDALRGSASVPLELPQQEEVSTAAQSEPRPLATDLEPATVDAAIDPLLVHDEEFVLPRPPQPQAPQPQAPQPQAPQRRTTRPTPPGLLRGTALDKEARPAVSETEAHKTETTGREAAAAPRPAKSTTPFRSRAALREIGELDFPKEF